MAERLPESQFIPSPLRRIYEAVASCFNALLDQVTTLELTDHTQGTDTALGAQAEDLDMNSFQIVNLAAPAAVGEAIRQTATITEASIVVKGVTWADLAP